MFCQKLHLINYSNGNWISSYPREKDATRNFNTAILQIGFVYTHKSHKRNCRRTLSITLSFIHIVTHNPRNLWITPTPFARFACYVINTQYLNWYRAYWLLFSLCIGKLCSSILWRQMECSICCMCVRHNILYLDRPFILCEKNMFVFMYVNRFEFPIR